jgi:hypothetical protein
MELEEQTDEKRKNPLVKVIARSRHNCTKVQLISAMFNLDLQHKLIFGWYEVR